MTFEGPFQPELPYDSMILWRKRSVKDDVLSGIWKLTQTEKNLVLILVGSFIGDSIDFSLIWLTSSNTGTNTLILWWGVILSYFILLKWLYFNEFSHAFKFRNNKMYIPVEVGDPHTQHRHYTWKHYSKMLGHCMGLEVMADIFWFWTMHRDKKLRVQTTGWILRSTERNEASYLSVSVICQSLSGLCGISEWSWSSY